ncbi:MAG TPA: ABC transporter permease [Candidatus Bathyarchaeia archaeon]|nr:ABC transporter permease [Candidatus Bathyarchaeia archaeon]
MIATSPARSPAAAETTAPAAASRSAGAVLARRLLLPVLVIALLIGAWDVAIRVLGIPNYVIPSPAAVGQALVKERARLLDNAVPTIVESLGGFALGNLVAIAAAIAFVHNATLERALYPVAVAVRTLPVVAIAPIFVLMLGNGYAPKIAIAALITFFPTLVNMVEGLESADPQALELMHVLSATRTETFRYVRWPSSLPYLFSAMRIASTSSVLGALVAEWIGTNKGLGYLIVLTTYDFRTALLYAAMVVTSAIALAFFFLVSVLEWLLVRWER